MKLSQLKYFCTVEEQKTIAAAASELHCVPVLLLPPDTHF